MTYNYETIINGKRIKFEDIEDEPLLFEMILTPNYRLYRDICPDYPFERWILHHSYTDIINGKPERRLFKYDVYNGKNIENETFLNELLIHVIEGAGIKL